MNTVNDCEVEKHIQSLTQQMKQLNNDISLLLPLIESLDGEQAENLSNKLSDESELLLKSLLSLTS
ncbi:hypothetical protein SM124_00155 [Bacillus sp. 31A1R]|uniref:Uncharacterized protein n=1 Tax=Robertmurraya mangrovi TaxID=3098077 RepID=A0ABU5ISK1_9BACI|nr:hypothetical protein [Bacillus sp. 31A1R]MDZ5470147.1 hypothetical protein [Bacillus sp. 31A1R]